jgi:Tol biopolymer transport system component
MIAHPNRRAVIRRLLWLPVAAVLAVGPVPSTALATTPGDNGRIVYSAQTAKGLQLFTVRPDGGDIRQITSVDGDAAHADWSPDGRRLVFEFAGATHAGVMLVNRDGSGLRDLTPTGFQGNPAFTADGRRIVFDSNDGGIAIMRTDGSGRRPLTRNPFAPTGFDTDANVSPDGRFITFVRVKVPEREQALFSIRADGSHLRQLTSYALEVGVKHDWAPDGSRIAIIVNADRQTPGTSTNVATIRPDGSGLRMLTRYHGGQINAFTGSYSPDGRWIVYRLEDHGKFTLAKLPAHGRGSGHRIVSLPEAPRFIDWGPRPRRAD